MLAPTIDLPPLEEANMTKGFKLFLQNISFVVNS